MSPSRLLSKTDNTKGDEMRYLVQPRGPGKSYVFRMATPPQLVGKVSPFTGKPFGTEIKLGLKTRRLGQYFVDAVTVRDMPVVQACGVAFSAVYVILNTLADVGAILANPRLMHPK